MKYLVFILLMFGLTACKQQSESENTRVLTYATPYSPSHPFSRADSRWIDYVESRSEGRLKIRPIWSGALLSSDNAILELRHGVADIGLITPIYTKGGAHLLRNQTGFYTGVRSVEDQLAVYSCMLKVSDQFEEELEGLKVLAVQGGNLPGIITRTSAVTKVADLEGLRLRVPTELLEMFKDLGADPISMPMGEVYSALAKGVIDGLVAPMDTFKSLHFVEVANHYTEMEIARGAYPARAISMKVWDTLSAESRALLMEAKTVWEQALAEEVRGSLDEGYQLAKEKGVQFHTIPEAEQVAFHTLYADFARTSAAALKQYGIDGMRVLEAAEASIRNDGIVCEGE